VAQRTEYQEQNQQNDEQPDEDGKESGRQRQVVEIAEVHCRRSKTTIKHAKTAAASRARCGGGIMPGM
jgi:hypothetical protein